METPTLQHYKRLLAESRVLMLASRCYVRETNSGAHAGELPWETPTLQHYEQLLAESEFAAWVLVNGYCPSHATISVHRAGIKCDILLLH